MTTLDMRTSLLTLIGQALQAGARHLKACALIGLTTRTVQRWLEASKAALRIGDRRSSELRCHNHPPNKLSDAERQAAMAVLNSEHYKDLPPSQIVPRLADLGSYV